MFGYVSLSQAGQWDMAGQASLDLRYFPSAVAFPNQKNTMFSPSGSLQPELVYESADRDDRFTFTPFIRLDADDKRRTHSDIREANWLHVGSNWDVVVGIGKVFWGVTESVHLVDIINQSDAVEDISGEQKLGQPMVNFSIEQTWGVFNLIALPGFRPRTFSADNARLHGPLPIDAYNETYESGQGKRHIDWAARWSHTFSDVDVALSHFQGTSREPLLRLQNRAGTIIAVPHYNQIGQTGFEFQLTTNNTLWKAEAFSRSGHGKRFYAAVAGFEHTLYGVFDSSMDIGLLMGYLSDNRDPSLAPSSSADNDLFAGLRFCTSAMCPRLPCPD
ncbi:MAG: hypothetical protein JKY87_01430 [Mariprofundus sp.]|nr:hypothetical protein [Mariprofundus sp.]